MPTSRQVHVFRDETELGVLPEGEIKPLLEIGFLKATDCYWCEGMDCHSPLSEWQVAAVTQAATDKTVTLAQKARQLAGKVRAFTAEKTKTLSGAKDKALESFLPQIKEIVSRVLKTKPIVSIRSSLNDDEFMTKVFGATYDCLPKPVQRFVDEERFIAFCRQHKQKLLD